MRSAPQRVDHSSQPEASPFLLTNPRAPPRSIPPLQRHRMLTHPESTPTPFHPLEHCSVCTKLNHPLKHSHTKRMSQKNLSLSLCPPQWPSSTPCNGAPCLEDAGGGPTCACPPGWTSVSDNSPPGIHSCLIHSKTSSAFWILALLLSFLLVVYMMRVLYQKQTLGKRGCAGGDRVVTVAGLFLLQGVFMVLTAGLRLSGRYIAVDVASTTLYAIGLAGFWFGQACFIHALCVLSLSSIRRGQIRGGTPASLFATHKFLPFMTVVTAAFSFVVIAAAVDHSSLRLALGIHNAGFALSTATIGWLGTKALADLLYDLNETVITGSGILIVHARSQTSIASLENKEAVPEKILPMKARLQNMAKKGKQVQIICLSIAASEFALVTLTAFMPLMQGVGGYILPLSVGAIALASMGTVHFMHNSKGG